MELLLVIAAIVAVIACVRAYKYYQYKQRRDQLLRKYGDKDLVEKIMKQLVWQGMSEDQLIDSWGAPVARDRKIYKTKVSETFKYNQKGRNRFGSRVWVENGIVVGWEQK
jgi:hypothetical protein